MGLGGCLKGDSDCVRKPQLDCVSLQKVSFSQEMSRDKEKLSPCLSNFQSLQTHGGGRDIVIFRTGDARQSQN